MSKEQLSTSKKEVPKLRNALEEKYKEQKVESVEEVKRVDETNVGSIKDELPVTGSAAKPTSKKMPEPIILPVTIDVASKTPSTLLESDIYYTLIRL